MTGIINCAHRGASGLAPENTIAALELAARLGASMAEIDIQQTADDQLVLFHDDSLRRTSNGSGPLWKKTLGQLKLLDAGSWFSEEYVGEGIPTLADAVATTRGLLKLNIELKLHGHERKLAFLAAKKLQDLDCLPWCLTTSFDREVIDQLGELLPGLKTGYIVDRLSWDDALLETRVSVLSLEKSLITSELVQSIHAAGKEVHVWTVNEPEQMRRLQEMGADVLISNFPDRVTKVFLPDDPANTR